MAVAGSGVGVAVGGSSVAVACSGVDVAAGASVATAGALPAHPTKNKRAKTTVIPNCDACWRLK